MMPAAQDLPSFDLAIRPDHYTTIVPNLSYPSRPNTHIRWSGSSAPLVFSKTTRPEMTVSGTNVQVPTSANLWFDTSSVLHAVHGARMLIWHSLLVIVQKLKLIKRKFFGVRTTSVSVTASV